MRENPEPCDVGDDVIELHVLGRLEDVQLRAHLENCEVCRERVIEYREYIAVLRKALMDSRPPEH